MKDADSRVDSWQSTPPDPPKRASSVRPRPPSMFAAQLGFDDPSARVEWLEAHGVRSREDWAAHLLAQVIDPSTEALVAALEDRPERARARGGLALPHRYHVVTFGQTVESTDYFELRLQLGARYFGAGEEITTLLTALGRLERAMVAAVMTLPFEEDFTAAELVDHVLAIASLDRTLAVAGYWRAASATIALAPPAAPAEGAAPDASGPLETSPEPHAPTESEASPAADEKVEHVTEADGLVLDEDDDEGGARAAELLLDDVQLGRAVSSTSRASRPAENATPVWAKLTFSARDAERNGLSLSIAVMSLDASSDTIAKLGREVCGELLASASERVRRVVTDEDAVGPVGPTELLIVFRGVPATQAALVCDRLRLRIRREPLTMQPHPGHRAARNLTVSFGVVQLGIGESPKALLERAQRALGRARAAGPDRVELDRSRPITKP
ncbi:MAG: diguanylate cyclase [Sandaracinaceae bacterium]|nr:diguanylate cyclase [Sandaracinaceae bacterium]